MIKVQENKVLSVLVNYEFEVQVSDADWQCPIIFFVANGEPEYIDTLYLSKDVTTVEELKGIAANWYKNHVGETRVLETIGQEIPTLAQLELHSQNAMMVEIKDIKFIIGEEVPSVMIIKDGEIIEEDFQEIFSLSDLERYAIKWYYKNVLGVEF